MTLVTLLIVAVIGSVVYLPIAKKYPGIVLALMWGMFAIEQVLQSYVTVLVRHSWLSNVALTALASIAVALTYSREFAGRSLPKAYIPAIILYAIAFLSLIWSVSPAHTELQLLKYAPYIVAGVFIAPLTAISFKQMQVSILTTVWFGAFVLVASLFSKMGTRGLILEESFQRGTVEGNPLAMADFAGTVAICAVFSLYARRSNLLLGTVYLLIAGFASYIIIRSGSRGQMIALACVCFVWLPFTARVALRRSTIISLTIGVGLTAFGIWAIEYFDLAARWEWANMREASRGRLEMTQGLLSAWASGGAVSLLAGLGNSASFAIVGFYPHNMPAEVLGEEGVLGFLVLVVFVGIVFKLGFKLLSEHMLSVDERLSIGVLMALFSFSFVLSLKQGSLLGSTNFFAFGLSLGWLYQSATIRVKESALVTRRAFAQGLPQSGSATRNFNRQIPDVEQPRL